MERDVHKINPHYDKDHDQIMVDSGWRINHYGEWSMPADVYISRQERQRILKILAQDKAAGQVSSVNEDLDALSVIDTMGNALKVCLNIGQGIRREAH